MYLITVKTKFLFIDILLLWITFAYITWDVKDVPFHGDEATTIWMGRDFDTVILNGDFNAVAFQEKNCTVELPRCNANQHMRIITSNLSKIAMGVAWSNSGFSVHDLNEQWVWGLDKTWNSDNGHVPSPRLLQITRLSSAWLTALSCVFLLATARRIARSLFQTPTSVFVASWAAVFFYATHAAILLNGKRAMFEGGLLFGITLMAWAVFANIHRFPRLSWRFVALTGILTGLALSTKHSATLTVVILYGGWVIWGLFRLLYARQIRPMMLHIAQLTLATILALGVFYAMNPLWWSISPLRMADYTIQERQKILDEQVALFGGYENNAAKAEGLWKQMFRPTTQYYETPSWATYEGVTQEIITYETSGFVGLSHETSIYFVRLSAFFLGVIVLVIHFSRTRAAVICLLLVWTVAILIISYVTIPLPWQRYYLSIHPPLTIIMGIGIGVFMDYLSRLFSPKSV